jgi:hypothetical protein
MLPFVLRYPWPLLLFLIPFLICPADAQTASDTSAVSAAADTSEGGGIDTLVVYSASDSVVYSIRTRVMNLYGKTQTDYGTLGLKAERVAVNWDNSTLISNGVPDTAKTDSVIGRPIMKDAGEEYNGETIRYNFRTKKGKVKVGETEIEKGYFNGSDIKKFEADVLYISDGRYTTCDEDHPHFYFASPKMKLLVKDKVVAEPVFFYVADVPLFALPFAVFPAHGGRSSGIITPAYGEDSRRGKYLSHLGYYFAISDYVDLATMVDLYTRGGWLNQSTFRYHLRDNFSGALNTRFTNIFEGEEGDPQGTTQKDYYLNWSHNQQIDPTSRADANFTFASGSFFRNYSQNLTDILRQNILSNGSYSKSFANGQRSLSVSVSRDQSLTTNDVREVLPAVSFSQGTFFPFRSSKKTRGLSTSTEGLGFFDMLGLSYSASFNNARQKITTTLQDSIKVFSNNTSHFEKVKDFTQSNQQSLNQGFGLSISPKLGNFTVSPSFSFSDSRSWLETETPIRNPADSTLAFRTDESKSTAGRLNTGVGISTRFYGVATPRLLGVTALRHTVNPTVSFNYSKQVYGERIPKYSLSGAFNVSNNYEAKYQKADSAQEEKLQLFNWGGAVSYDFARDSLNFSDVSLNFRTELGRLLNISGGANYNLYKYDPLAGQRVNKLLFDEEGKLGDLTSFSLSLSTSFRGEKKKSGTPPTTPADVEEEQQRVSSSVLPQPGQRKIYQSIYDKEEADFSIPWNISLSYSFGQSQPIPGVINRQSSANMNLSFNLTDKWQISTGASYDFVTKKHFIPSVDVTRDLHCWTMSFSWYPMGIREGYRFELKVKAPQLQDIKVTRQSANRASYY